MNVAAQGATTEKLAYHLENPRITVSCACKALFFIKPLRSNAHQSYGHQDELLGKEPKVCLNRRAQLAARLLQRGDPHAQALQPAHTR